MEGVCRKENGASTVHALPIMVIWSHPLKRTFSELGANIIFCMCSMYFKSAAAVARQ